MGRTYQWVRDLSDLDLTDIMPLRTLRKCFELEKRTILQPPDWFLRRRAEAMIINTRDDKCQDDCHQGCLGCPWCLGYVPGDEEADLEDCYRNGGAPMPADAPAFIED